MSGRVIIFPKIFDSIKDIGGNIYILAICDKYIPHFFKRNI